MTEITNSGATETASSYEICMRSGRKVKRGTLVQEEWTGAWVHPDYAEPRNEQDLIKSAPERQRGAKRPEPIGNERFIVTAVSADDL